MFKYSPSVIRSFCVTVWCPVAGLRSEWFSVNELGLPVSWLQPELRSSYLPTFVVSSFLLVTVVNANELELDAYSTALEKLLSLQEFKFLGLQSKETLTVLCLPFKTQWAQARPPSHGIRARDWTLLPAVPKAPKGARPELQSAERIQGLPLPLYITSKRSPPGLQPPFQQDEHPANHQGVNLFLRTRVTPTPFKPSLTTYFLGPTQGSFDTTLLPLITH